jgi:hypothetical protein
VSRGTQNSPRLSALEILVSPRERQILLIETMFSCMIGQRRPSLLRASLVVKPVDGCPSFITGRFPGSNLATQCFLIRNAVSQTLLTQDADLYLYHIQLAAMLRRVMKLQAVQNASRFRRLEGLVERCWGKRAVTLYHQHDPVRFRKEIIDQVLHTMSQVNLGSLFCHFHVTPTGKRLIEKDSAFRYVAAGSQNALGVHALAAMDGVSQQSTEPSVRQSKLAAFSDRNAQHTQPEHPPCAKRARHPRLECTICSLLPAQAGVFQLLPNCLVRDAVYHSQLHQSVGEEL